MSDRPQPTLEEIAAAMAHLADNVSSDPGPDLDPLSGDALRQAIAELEQTIPGLEPPANPQAARFQAESAEAALQAGHAREALARALRGLSFAPHHPTLHYLAGAACLELGAPTEALVLLMHCLWVNPAHPDARRDLDTLQFMQETAAERDDPYAQGEDDDGVSRDEVYHEDLDIEPNTWEHGFWFDEDAGEEKRAA